MNNSLFQLLSRYKNSMKIIILGSYYEINRLTDLKKHLFHEGYVNTILAKDIVPSGLEPGLSKLDQDTVNYFISQYVIKNSDFRIFVFMRSSTNTPNINTGVSLELQMYLMNKYPLYECIVLVEGSLYKKGENKLELGSSLVSGMIKGYRVPYRIFYNDNEMKTIAEAALTSILWQKLASDKYI